MAGAHLLQAKLRLPQARRQAGSALIVAMVFLIILTILGVSSMNTARLEVKVANNIQFSDLAFQAAESGIDSLLATGALKRELDTDPDDTTPFSQTSYVGCNFSIRPCTVSRGCWTPTRASSTVAVHGEGQNHPRSDGQRR